MTDVLRVFDVRLEVWYSAATYGWAEEHTVRAYNELEAVARAVSCSFAPHRSVVSAKILSSGAYHE